MKAVLKAVVALWYAFLTAAFCLLAFASVLIIFYGFSSESNEAVGAGIMGILTFGWGTFRASGKFTARMEETKKNSEHKYEDWE